MDREKIQEKEDSFDACRNGPRRYTGLPIVDETYETQRFLEDMGERARADNVMSVRLLLKGLLCFLDFARASGLDTEVLKYGQKQWPDYARYMEVFFRDVKKEDGKAQKLRLVADSTKEGNG